MTCHDLSRTLEEATTLFTRFGDVARLDTSLGDLYIKTSLFCQVPSLASSL